MADYISVTETAKILRGELKKHFPGVVFSVRSSSYSMGASIDMEWLDGPTKSEVEVITNEFEGSTFDGMTDMKSNRYTTWQGREVSWGADSVSTVRRYSKSLYSQVVDQVCKKHGIPTPEIIQDSYTYKGKTSYGNPYIADNNIQIGCDDLSTLIRRELDKTSAYVKPAETDAIAVNSNADGITVTVTENTEKNGIEITFSSKPPDDVIESISRGGAGFIYHRTKNKWYAKKTDDKVKFAAELAARFNQPQQSDQPVPLEGYNNLNDAQKAVIDKGDRAQLLQIARRCGLSLHQCPNLTQQVVWLFEELNKSKQQPEQKPVPTLLDCLNLLIDICDRLTMKPIIPAATNSPNVLSEDESKQARSDDQKYRGEYKKLADQILATVKECSMKFYTHGITKPLIKEFSLCDQKFLGCLYIKHTNSRPVLVTLCDDNETLKFNELVTDSNGSYQRFNHKNCQDADILTRMKQAIAAKTNTADAPATNVVSIGNGYTG